MNELQTFASNEFGAVRSMMIGDVPRFVGRDVAVALGRRGQEQEYRNDS